MSAGILLVRRIGPSAIQETHIEIIQGNKVWIVNPTGDIHRATGGSSVSYPFSIVDFLSGLADAGFQVIVHRHFVDELGPTAFEHKRIGGIVNHACYLYGLAWAKNQWDDVVEQLNRFVNNRNSRKHPYFNNHMRILKLTGAYYAINSWQARCMSRLTIQNV